MSEKITQKEIQNLALSVANAKTSQEFEYSWKMLKLYATEKEAIQ